MGHINYISVCCYLHVGNTHIKPNAKVRFPAKSWFRATNGRVKITQTFKWRFKKKKLSV